MKLIRVAVLLAAASLSGCAVASYLGPVYGEVDNLSDPDCSRSFSGQLASALEEEGETPEDAADAAARTVRSIPSLPRPLFEAASASGVSYGGYLEPRHSGACMLRIYERRKGNASTQNTLTFFASRRLESCTCSWTVYSSNVGDE
jgi:hypothetical protein